MGQVSRRRAPRSPGPPCQSRACGPPSRGAAGPPPGCGEPHLTPGAADRTLGARRQALLLLRGEDGPRGIVKRTKKPTVLRLGQPELERGCRCWSLALAERPLDDLLVAVARDPARARAERAAGAAAGDPQRRALARLPDGDRDHPRERCPGSRRCRSRASPSSGNGAGPPEQSSSTRLPGMSRAPGLMRGFASSQSVGRRKPSAVAVEVHGVRAAAVLVDAVLEHVDHARPDRRVAVVAVARASSRRRRRRRRSARRSAPTLSHPTSSSIVSPSPPSVSRAAVDALPEAVAGEQRVRSGAADEARPRRRRPRAGRSRRRRRGALAAPLPTTSSSPGPAETSSTSARTLSSSPAAPSSRTPSSVIALRRGRLGVVDAIRAGAADEVVGPGPALEPCRRPSPPSMMSLPAPPRSVLPAALPKMRVAAEAAVDRLEVGVHVLRLAGAPVVGQVVEAHRVVAGVRSAPCRRRLPPMTSSLPNPSEDRVVAVAAVDQVVSAEAVSPAVGERVVARPAQQACRAPLLDVSCRRRPRRRWSTGLTPSPMKTRSSPSLS